MISTKILLGELNKIFLLKYKGNQSINWNQIQTSTGKTFNMLQLENEKSEMQQLYLQRYN